MKWGRAEGIHCHAGQVVRVALHNLAADAGGGTEVVRVEVRLQGSMPSQQTLWGRALQRQNWQQGLGSGGLAMDTAAPTAGRLPHYELYFPRTSTPSNWVVKQIARRQPGHWYRRGTNSAGGTNAQAGGVC